MPESEEKRRKMSVREERLRRAVTAYGKLQSFCLLAQYSPSELFRCCCNQVLEAARGASGITPRYNVLLERLEAAAGERSPRPAKFRKAYTVLKDYLKEYLAAAARTSSVSHPQEQVSLSAS